jgi:tetratricopeptide (TPR) repeat protein
MSDDARLESLRRRVHADPMSIAFAALAEEYRRAGRLVEAVDVCRTGLARHPAYLSAHVTLGRALLDLNELDAAEAELRGVLERAPDNIAAARALAELGERRQTRSSGSPPPPANVIPFGADPMPSTQPVSQVPAFSPMTASQGAAPELNPLDRLLHAIVTLKRATV